MTHAIRYTDSLDGITPAMLDGFFDGWVKRPSPQAHLRILQNSYLVILGIDDHSGQVVGFINAISDGVLSAYIPLLEVRGDFRSRGIGTELTRRMLAKLKDFYMVDVLGDPKMQGFYERCGMTPAAGMMIRNPAAVTKL